MPYCFRYRVRMCTPPKADADTEFVLNLPGFPDVNVSVIGTAHPIGSWVKFCACGYASEDAARNAGAKLGEALAMAGAVEKLGIDLGFSRTTQQFSKEVLDAMRSVDGKETRTEMHGLMVYEGQINVVGLNIRGDSTIDQARLSDHLRRWLAEANPLTERQKICAGLINDSFFVSSPEAQFVLCVSAVEALCERVPATAAHRDFVDQLIRHLAALPGDEAHRNKVSSRLGNLKTMSIGDAIRAKIEVYLDAAEAEAFAKLYNMRSAFLHNGKGRGELQAPANDARDLATALLRAEVINFRAATSSWT